MSHATPGPPPGSREREKERRAAKRAVARAWHSTGWSKRPSLGVDYRPLRAALGKYVQVTYSTPPSLTTEIVDVTLQAYLAPLHAGRIYVGLLSDEGLLGEADDQALHRTRSDQDLTPDAEHPFGVTRSTVDDDAALTRELFDASPDAVREALSQLSSEGRELDFIIITEYLDIGTKARTRLVNRVAENLQKQQLLIKMEVDIRAVQEAVRRFHRRLRGMG